MGPGRRPLCFKTFNAPGCRLADQKIASGIHLDRVMAIMYNWKDIFCLVSIL
jgi:hypothetical protein